MMNQPAKQHLRPAQLINMSLGFLGIQMGFALQNGNASRILQTFGAEVEQLSLFWLAAPLTGMLIQPIIGHYSDRTWTKLGRRRPYFLIGAILTAAALILMPNVTSLTRFLPPLVIGAGMLMIMDASMNVTMEPFRALVADNLSEEQRSRGFSVQTFLIGLGAVIGSWLPYALAEYIGVPKTAAVGHVPENVILSFYVGSAVLVFTVIWTVVKTREYPPNELAAFEPDGWKEQTPSGLKAILVGVINMPKAMRQLGVVQFFSWFALFSMWVFTTPVVADHIYGTAPNDTSSQGFADASNWVGVLFGVYNAIAALYALVLPKLTLRFGQEGTHAFSLICGGLSLISIYFIHNSQLLILPMLGIGMAWASILAMPYAILSVHLPGKKMGVYMGIFNFFVTFPQIINGFLGGLIVRYIFGGKAIFALVLAGAFMLLAAVSVLKIGKHLKIHN